jgi:aspartate/glutamate racemase
VSLIEMAIIAGLSLSSTIIFLEVIIALCRHRLNQRAAAAYRRYHSRDGVDD